MRTRFFAFFLFAISLSGCMSFENYPGRPADGTMGPNGRLLWFDRHDNEYFLSELKIEKPANQPSILVHSAEVLRGQNSSGNHLVISEEQALSIASDIRNWIKGGRQGLLTLGPFSYRNEEFRLLITTATYKVQGDKHTLRFQILGKSVNNRHPLKIKEVEGLAMAFERAANEQ